MGRRAGTAGLHPSEALAARRTAAIDPPATKRTLGSIKDKIADATWMTVSLAFCSMPIAILLGILIAVGRLYGPGFLRIPLSAYVEVLRGTPMLLQMYVWFFLCRKSRR